MNGTAHHGGGTGIEIDGRPFVPVRINGTGPFWLLLDTGCIGCRVNTRVAERLGLPVDQSGATSLDTLAIGSAQWEDVGFGVADDPVVAELLGRNFDGFLGNGFLWYVREAFELTIDYPRESLAFTPRGAGDRRGSAEGVEISIENYYAVIPVRINGQGPYRFVLDTGAASCFVSLAVASELGLPEGETVTARGPDTVLDATRSRVSVLRVGAAMAHDMDVLVTNCSDVSGYVGGRVEGYLGTSFLRGYALTLNYAGARLWLR
jgi:predicted aspartyl protease